MKPWNGRLDGVPFRAAADVGGRLVDPRFVVIHYTGGTRLEGATNTLTAEDDKYVSAHLLIDKDGTERQLVPLTRIAYHAGKSRWRGLDGLNAYSIGIELVSPGWRTDGLPNWPTLRAQGRSGGPARDWYLYPEEQIAALEARLSTLFELFPSLSEIVGHDEIAPGRKNDPGPAFPWKRIRAQFPRRAAHLVP